MFDTNINQYILEQTSGKVINISGKSNSGIELKILDDNGIWSKPNLITSDSVAQYSVNMDSKDNIHIIYQDKQGNIKYLNPTNEKCLSKSILKTRNPGSHNRHPSIVSSNGKIHFFYMSRYSNRKVLTHQYLNSRGELSESKVIDYVVDNDFPYFVMEDSDDNLYIFYTYCDSRYSHLGYKIYSPTRGNWSEFQSITEYTSESNILYCTPDFNNNIYVYWEKNDSRDNELACSIKDNNSDDWKEEKVIAVSSKPFRNFSCLTSNDKITASWIHDNKTMLSQSTDEGNTWSSPQVCNLDLRDSYEHIWFITNNPNCRFQKQMLLPAKINNEYKLFFIHDQKEVPENREILDSSDKDSCMIKISRSLDFISKELDGLKSLLLEIESKIESFEIYQNRIEAELCRYNNNIGSLDEELNDIKEKLDSIPSAKAILVDSDEDDVSINSFVPNNVSNTPIMPGSGFANITPEFLKNLGKK